VTGHSYSLVDMESDAVANKLAFVENDFAVINANHGPQLVVQELLPAAFDILGEPNPVAHREHDLLPLKHAKIARLVKRQPLLDAILSDNDTSLLTSKDFPLFAAFKTLFFDSSVNSSLGHPVKLEDLPYGGGISRSLQILRTNKS
jgi:hypothetical protein